MGDRVSAIHFFNQAAAIPKPQPYNAAPQLQYQLFGSAAMTDPTMGQAFYELANLTRDMGMNPAAIATFRKMLELPVSDVPGDMTLDMKCRAMVNMSHALYTIGQPKEAEQIALKALGIDPSLVMGWCNLSMVESVTDRLHDSLHHAQMALALDPNDPVAKMTLAFAYLYAGDFANGLKFFEERFPYKLQHFLKYPYPKWSGEEDKTIYMVSEQGLGDALSFSRFIERTASRCKFIHIVVQKELVRVLRAAFQHIKNISIMGAPQPFMPADYWTTPMSLPTALGLTTEEIASAPNIRIPQFMTNATAWKNPDAKFHIGVAWSGSPASEINHWRSFPVTQLLELYRVPGIQLYSIQTNDQVKELHNAGCAVLIRDLAPHISDVADTIAIMDHLDLVITTESAPGHIAGHAGIETIIPYSYAGRDWRIGPLGGVPIWYPKTLAIKQGPEMQWPPVFEKIIDMVRKKIDAKG